MPIELKNKAYWAVKTLNMNYTTVGEKIILDIHELEELRYMPMKMPEFTSKEPNGGMIDK